MVVELLGLSTFKGSTGSYANDRQQVLILLEENQDLNAEDVEPHTPLEKPCRQILLFVGNRRLAGESCNL